MPAPKRAKQNPSDAENRSGEAGLAPKGPEAIRLWASLWGLSGVVAPDSLTDRVFLGQRKRDPGQPLELCKVRVRREQDRSELDHLSRDPQIVGRDRPALGAKRTRDASEAISSGLGDRDRLNVGTRKKGLELSPKQSPVYFLNPKSKVDVARRNL